MIPFSFMTEDYHTRILSFHTWQHTDWQKFTNSL